MPFNIILRIRGLQIYTNQLRGILDCSERRLWYIDQQSATVLLRGFLLYLFNYLLASTTLTEADQRVRVVPATFKLVHIPIKIWYLNWSFWKPVMRDSACAKSSAGPQNVDALAIPKKLHCGNPWPIGNFYWWRYWVLRGTFADGTVCFLILVFIGLSQVI